MYFIFQPDIIVSVVVCITGVRYYIGRLTPFHLITNSVINDRSTIMIFLLVYYMYLVSYLHVCVL